MRPSIVFVITLLAMSGAVTASVGPCDDIAGHWVDVNAPYITYDCTQAANKSFTCTWTSAPHPGNTCVMTYTGNWDNTNLYFTYSAAYVSGTCSPSSWSGKLGVINQCSQMSDSQIDNWGGSGSWTQVRGTDGTHLVCEVPGTQGNGGVYTGGENASVFIGWGGTPNSWANYTATLNDHNDSNFNFSGRQTQEIVTLVSNGCSASFGIQSGGVWDPDVTHNYSVGWANGVSSPDSVGFSTNDLGLTYLWSIQRNYGLTLPCSITTQQEMWIDCPDANGDGGTTWVQYEVHNNVRTIGDGTITIFRNGAQAGPIDWGMPRSVWRWMDWWIANPEYW